jgi:hypothetical protein
MLTAAMRHLSLPVVLCSSLVLATACTKKSPPDAAAEQDQPKDPVTQAPVDGEKPAAAGQSLLEVEGIAKLIPGDAVFVGAIAGPQRVFSVFGRDEVVSKLGPLYVDASKEIREVTGQDLLSVEGISAFGVDPSAPVTMFMWTVDHPSSGGVVLKLRDRDDFLASVRSIASAENEELETHAHESATILCPKRGNDGCLVATVSHAYLVGADAGGGLELAKRIADLKPEQSLASNPAFARSLAHLEVGADMAGYLNLEPLVAQAMQALGSVDTPRDAAQAELLRSMLEPMRALVFGAGFEQRSLSGQMFVETKGVSLLSSLVKNGTRVSPVVNAMGEDAILLSSYNLDLDAIWSLAEKAAAAEGESMAELEREVRTLTGFDLRTDVIAAMSGEFGLGVQADVDQMFALLTEADGASADATEAKLIAAIDGAFTIGFADANKGRALLEKALADPNVAKLVVRDDARDLWTVSTPFGKTLLLAIASPPGGEPLVVVATNQDLLDRIVQGRTAPAFSGQPRHSGYVDLIGQRDVAVLYAGRQILFGAGVWVSYIAFGADSSMAAKPALQETPEHTKIRDELEAVATELEQIRREESRDQAMLLGEFLSPWGATAGSLRVTTNGIDVRMGQFIEAPSWAALASGLVDSGKKMASLSNKHAARKTELYELERELWAKLNELGAG